MKKYIYETPNDKIYMTDEDGLTIKERAVFVREVVIDACIGDDVNIGFFADVHLNRCNAQDFEEADPVIMSTYKRRTWAADGYTVYKLRNALSLLKDMDRIVVGGDILDYQSHGAMELADKELWDKVPNVLCVVGGHEFCKQMEGDVDETTTREERAEALKKYWRHDIYYFSQVIKNKVMLIGMLNDLATFTKEQQNKLTRDIELARKCGYVILMFFHEPIATKNPRDSSLAAEDMLVEAAMGCFPYDFCAGFYESHIMVGNDRCDKVTKDVYDLITNNADVIKGIFAGHLHNEMYLEVAAKNADGTDTYIPEFVVAPTAFSDAHVMKIVVK